MQNMFLHSKGTLAEMGLPVGNMSHVIPIINRLRSSCHEAAIPVIFTRMGFSADYSDAGILLERHPQIKELGGGVHGTWDADVIDELKPGEDEFVVDKTRNTAFWKTKLVDLLEQRGINHLIVTGVATEICVESTVRDAFTNGIHVTTISDATATLEEDVHRVTLKTLDLWFGGTATTEEVQEALKSSRSRSE